MLIVSALGFFAVAAIWDSGSPEVSVVHESVSPERQWAAQEVHAGGGGAAGWISHGVRLGRLNAEYDDQDWIVRDDEFVVEQWGLAWTDYAELTIGVRCDESQKLPQLEFTEWGDVRIKLERLPE
ncbi:MAG: hypothetical protein AAF196_16195 [Planctomycetota bacterium]